MILAINSDFITEDIIGVKLIFIMKHSRTGGLRCGYLEGIRSNNGDRNPSIRPQQANFSAEQT